MKMITKVCLVISVSLFILGAAALSVGMLMGVTPSRLRYEGRPLGRFSLRQNQKMEVTEAELTDTPGVPQAPSGNISAQAETYYEFKDIESLDMELGLCELYLFSHKEDYLAVCADNTQSYFTCRQAEDTLLLKDSRPTSTKQNSMSQALKLELYLPEREYEDICIDMGAGNITMVLLSAENVEIESGAGNVTIGTLSCEDLAISAGVGELQADSLKISDSANIELGTGNAVISQFTGNNLALDCAIGNATVTAEGRKEDYDYRLQALGSVCLNHQNNMGETHHGSHHNNPFCLESINGNDRQLSVTCALGNAELNFTQE